MKSWYDWNSLAAVFTVIGAVATAAGLIVALWALFLGRAARRRSQMRLQIGPLPYEWSDFALIYGVSPDRSLLGMLPIVLRNHSKGVAANGISLEVVVPAGANAFYRSDNVTIGMDLQRGIVPGMEYRVTSLGEFVHLHWYIPTMNPGTAALLVVPFVCQPTEIDRRIPVTSKDGVLGTVQVKADFGLVFRAILHSSDSPPSVRTFEVMGVAAGDASELVSRAVKKGLCRVGVADQWRVWERILLRNKKVVFVMPAVERWVQDGVGVLTTQGGHSVPVYRESLEKSSRYLFTGYVGLSRLRQLNWRFT